LTSITLSPNTTERGKSRLLLLVDAWRSHSQKRAGKSQKGVMMSSKHLLLVLGAFLLIAVALLFTPTARAATSVRSLAFTSPPSIPAATVITVTNTDDSGTGSLRQAIASAGTTGTTIVFSLTLPNKITLTSGQLVITKSLTISGTNPLSLTISGSNSSRVFNISNGANVTITNLTMRDSLVLGGSGGVILHSNSGTLTLSNSRVISGSNSAGNGGGIYHSAGVLNISATTIYSNTSASGAGIYVASVRSDIQ
jgi:hypothetical protein